VKIVPAEAPSIHASTGPVFAAAAVRITSGTLAHAIGAGANCTKIVLQTLGGVGGAARGTEVGVAESLTAFACEVWVTLRDLCTVCHGLGAGFDWIELTNGIIVILRIRGDSKCDVNTTFKRR